MEEFESFLDKTSDTPQQVVLLGDFNLHIDIPDKWDTKQFIEIIAAVGFYQHVGGPTHTMGHTLDLRMTISFTMFRSTPFFTRSGP